MVKPNLRSRLKRSAIAFSWSHALTQAQTRLRRGAELNANSLALREDFFPSGKKTATPGTSDSCDVKLERQVGFPPLKSISTRALRYPGRGSKFHYTSEIWPAHYDLFRDPAGVSRRLDFSSFTFITDRSARGHGRSIAIAEHRKHGV